MRWTSAFSRGRVPAVAAAVVLVAGLGTVTAGPAVAAVAAGPAASSTSCPDVLVLGVRGAGEAPQPDSAPGDDGLDSMGRENWAVYSGLKEAYQGRANVAEQGIVYPADAVPLFFTAPADAAESVANGATNLAGAIEDTTQRCGSQTAIVVTGYSEGAWAVHKGLKETSAAARAHVAAVLLFGDPLYDPLDPFDRSGNPLGGGGIAQPIAAADGGLPPDMALVAASWCTNNDIVCQPLIAGPRAYRLCVSLQPDPACPHTLYVERGATDAGVKFATKRLALPFDIVTSFLPAATRGLPYAATLSTQFGRAPIVFTPVGKVPPNITLSGDGHFTGVPGAAGSFNVRVCATDADGRKATATFTLLVLPTPPLVITTLSLPDAAVAAPYTTTVSASGGIPPYGWTAAGLPPGVTIGVDGQLGGTPESPGTFPVTVTVTDHAGATSSATLSLTVQDQVIPGDLTIDTVALPDAVLGVPYGASISGHGGTAPYSWSQASSQTYPGLAFDPSTATVAGTPTQYGEWFLVVNLTDSTGTQVQQVFYLRVLSSPTPATVLPAMTLGQPYSTNLTLPAGLTPASWAMANGPGEFLQRGLTLNPSTGAVSGTPFVFFNEVATDSHFTVAVTDTSGNRTLIDYSIPVEGCRTAQC